MASEDSNKGASVAEGVASDMSDSFDSPATLSHYDLNELEAAAVCRAFHTRIIVVAGPPKCGKTTLLASLVEMFHKGLYQEYIFAGSDTIIGFESRSYDSRVPSGRKNPDTERTKANLDDIRFLHLAVRKQDFEFPPQHFLFSDIWGESFRQVKDSTTECKRLWTLKRADHVVMMFDCENLNDLNERQQAKAFGMSLMRSCLDAEMLGLESYVQIVFSKFDFVTSNSKSRRETELFIEQIKKEITDSFESRVGRLSFAEVAVRPDEDMNLQEGWGLDKLFIDWVGREPFMSRRKMNDLVVPPPTRQFCLFRHREMTK